MALPQVPAACEAQLVGVADCARLAVIIDCLMQQNGDLSTVTPVNAGSGNVANANAVGTMPAVAAKTNYITGFEVTGLGATAALGVNVTVAGLLGGSLIYNYAAKAGVLLANDPLYVKFPQPIPASAVNTAITVTCPALGAGNTNNSVNVHGFVK